MHCSLMGEGAVLGRIPVFLTDHNKTYKYGDVISTGSMTNENGVNLSICLECGAVGYRGKKYESPKPWKGLAKVKFVNKAEYEAVQL